MEACTKKTNALDNVNRDVFSLTTARPLTEGFFFIADLMFYKIVRVSSSRNNLSILPLTFNLF